MPVKTLAEPPLDLRDYQVRTLDAIQKAFQEHDSVLATGPTGSGKTVMFSEIVRRSARRSVLADILVHREELLKQSAATIKWITGVEPGIVWRGRQDWDAPIRVIAHGTLVARTELPRGVRRPKLLIVDEAHHAIAPGWMRGIQMLAPRWLLGFSATPFRQDKAPLTPVPFAVIIQSVTPAELIEIGALVPPVVVSPAVSDTNGEPQPIGKAANLPAIYTQAVRYALSEGRNKIILYVSGTKGTGPTEVARQTQRALHATGIPAGVIHERLTSRERERICQAFEKRPTAVLCNYMTLTEGFDSTAVDCVVLGRATQSESTLIQMIGRGLRLHEGKRDCLVIDFTGRNDVHDIINYWRLDGPRKDRDKEERKRKQEVTEDDLDNLQTALPKMISAMGENAADYPWLTPFPDRRVRVLRLWDPEQKSRDEEYVCVEPSAEKQWQITKVRIPRGRGATNRVARAGLSSQDAAKAVMQLVGNRHGIYRRDARWRMEPATDRQRRQWESVTGSQAPHDMTRGDASDAIATETFRNRVSARLL